MNVSISNISEDIWPFVSCLSAEARQTEINENAYLSDRELFILEPAEPSIFITPVAPDAGFLSYYTELFHSQNLQVWVTREHTGRTCYDVLQDKELFSRLVSLGVEEGLTITAYSATFEFYALVEALRAEGCSVSTPQAPEQAASWTVNFFGSKSGVRQTMQRLSGLRTPSMAKGVVSFGVADVAAVAASKYVQEGGVVLKTNKAHSGFGVQLFRAGDLPNEFTNCYGVLEEFLQKESYWSHFPVIVESLLDINLAVGGGNPNCEYRINKKGKLELLYTCGMRVSQEGVFKGVEISNTILPQNVYSELLQYGEVMGREYINSGYCGYFDVDCVYTKKNELLITESNMRRTGGTHVYHTARTLCGEDFLETHYILSDNNYRLPFDHVLSFQELHALLQPLLFSQETQEGLVVASANLLKQHTFAYIAVGKSKAHALEIEKKMEEVFRGVARG